MSCLLSLCLRGKSKPRFLDRKIHILLNKRLEIYLQKQQLMEEITEQNMEFGAGENVVKEVGKTEEEH